MWSRFVTWWREWRWPDGHLRRDFCAQCGTDLRPIGGGLESWGGLRVCSDECAETQYARHAW